MSDVPAESPDVTMHHGDLADHLAEDVGMDADELEIDRGSDGEVAESAAIAAAPPD